MKIIVSGCSYSCTPIDETYSKYLNEKYGHEVSNISQSGRSNQSIIKNIYDFINVDNIRDSYIVCQLTYTHRLGMFHDIFNRWYNYQPYGVKTISNGELNLNKIGKDSFLKDFNDLKKNQLANEISNDLLKFYETYLKWIYNDEAEFESLMLNVDMLTEWVKLNNNKIMFMYWPGKMNETETMKLKQRNFFNIDGKYSMLDFTKANALVDNHGHMNRKGNEYIAYEINEWINQ